MNRKPELLAPAGNLECARAAVANGADAVYFGLPRFNARMRADNFTDAELPGLVRFLHERNVRAIATLNILVFTDELADAEAELIRLDAAGVDAVLVQDLGVAALAQRLGLRMEVHASTQMTVTSPAGARFVAGLGIKRVVVARELSLRELAAFAEAGVEVEVFVHGALCVAYSGQCLTSEALGQRSANRGECASACRLPYELIVDGQRRELGDRRYLLSPHDLAGLRAVPELMRLGVAVLKIEGRLKSPEYVAAACQVYRKAIDAVPVTGDDWYKLEMAFSRGFTPGWLRGVNHRQLVSGRFGTKRGPLVGVVERVGFDHVELAKLECPLQAGDGVVVEAGRDQGGRVWEVRGRQLFFERGKIDFKSLSVGTRVWKTSDPRLEKALRQTFAGEIPASKRRLDLRVTGAAGERLVIEAAGARVESAMPLLAAAKRPLTTATLQAQLGRLGETDFALGEVVNELKGDVIVPVSELNRLRRELVGKLQEPEARSQKPEMLPPVLASLLPKRGSVPVAAPQLVVLCRTMEQVAAAVACGVETVYLDFEDPRRYAEAVRAGAEMFLATPRIVKPGEEGLLKAAMQAAGVLVRNFSGLVFPGRKVGDFSLNVANPLAAQVLIDAGLERVTVSYDLNAEQVVALLQAAPPAWFEVVIHQHLPMFHMDHCVFAAFLSNGTDHTNCGRPCDRHRVELRDRVGAEHLVHADVGCRNTVYHARAQSGAAFVGEFLAAGARTFRVELLDEDAAQARTVIQTYRQLLAGKTTPAEVSRRLRTVDQLGVTSGTLTVLG